ncbi:MAG: hypothetical protein ABI433_03490 [Burkholderiaceae bacterium]
MNTAPTAAATTAPSPAGTTGRPNLYVPIHKALRNMMCDALCRVGRIDVFDIDEMVGTLNGVESLLAMCLDHIEHEDTFIHAAIDARQPAGSARTGADHVEHIETIAALRAEVAALAAARSDERMNLALRLYRHLALFVAENFQHMHIEETVNAVALWAHYSDAELHQIHERLMASITPQKHLLAARWMVPALNPSERAGMFGAMKTQTPPEAFLGLLEHVRPHLDNAGWVKLTRAVGVPQVSGLVNMR